MIKSFLITILFLGFQTLVNAQIEKNVGNFTSLKTANRIKIELIPADENKVVVKESQEDAVNIINKNGRLVLKNTVKELVIADEYSVTLQVYFKELEEIDAQGGSYIFSHQPIEQNNLKLTANLGSVVELDLKLETLAASGNTGAKLILKGSVKESVKLNASAGAQIKAGDLQTARNKTVVNAGSSANITADEFVDARVVAGGNIKIHGNPKDVKEKVTAGGSIERVK